MYRTGISETVPSKTSPTTSRDGRLAKVSAKSDTISSVSKKTSPAIPKDSKLAKVGGKSDSKSSVSNKTSLATPRDGKLAKVSTKLDSKSSSTGQSLHLSIDRSPKLIDSKPSADKKSPKIPTPHDVSQWIQPNAIKTQFQLLLRLHLGALWSKSRNLKRGSLRAPPQISRYLAWNTYAHFALLRHQFQK